MNNFGFDESREKERAEYWKQYLLQHPNNQDEESEEEWFIKFRNTEKVFTATTPTDSQKPDKKTKTDTPGTDKYINKLEHNNYRNFLILK